MRRLIFGAALLLLFANMAAVTTGAVNDPASEVAAELPGDDFTPVPSTMLVPVTTTTVATTTTTAKLARLSYAVPDEPHVVIGRIEIPNLGLDVPLNEGISLTSIDFGPSHWPGTAMPGGTTGNVVVAGHRVTHTRPFRHIDTLVPGDEIIFTVNGVRSVYEMTSHEVVTPKQVSIAYPTSEPTATLFACHPPGSARYRYVVYAALVSTAPA